MNDIFALSHWNPIFILCKYYFLTFLIIYKLNTEDENMDLNEESEVEGDKSKEDDMDYDLMNNDGNGVDEDVANEEGCLQNECYKCFIYK